MIINYTEQINEYLEPRHYSIEVDDFIKCPICSKTKNDIYKINRDFNYISYNKKRLYYHNDTRILMIFKFKCNICQKVFVAEYMYREEIRLAQRCIELMYLGSERYGLDYINPSIEKLSPLFVKILHESQEIDRQGFYHVAGMGYRKALEFLVKHYLISKNPDMKSLIEKTELGQCIKDTNINNHLQKFKDVAYVAKELGNDETHFYRQYLKGKNNLEKMRKSIYLIIKYIESEIDLINNSPKLPKKKKKIIKNQ